MSRTLVLVTGSGGFVGRYLTRELSSRGADVLGVDVAEATVCVDITSDAGLAEVADALRGRERDRLAVAHLAGCAHGPTCEADPALARRLNVESVARVREVAAAAGADRFVLPSTALVYGAGHAEPVAEDAETCPAGVYATTKRAAESLLLDDGHGAGPKPVVLRLANVYGPGMHPDTLFSTIRAGLAAGRVALREYDSVRDYVFVEDVATALADALLGEPRRSLYNVGTGIGSSVRDVVAAMAAALGVRELAADVPQPSGTGAVLVLRNDRIREDLGWRPRHGLREGVAETIARETRA